MRCFGTNERIRTVENGNVSSLLVFKNPDFRIRIGFKIRVPIQMVSGNIQQNADYRPKAVNGVELKAADFGNHDICFDFSIHIPN